MPRLTGRLAGARAALRDRGRRLGARASRWRRASWRDERGDRGAVAAMVAVLLGGGALLGFGAIVIDVGQIYVERSELQTGADAAVVAVAKACSIRDPDCSSRGRVNALARRYGNINSADGLSRLVHVCGRLSRLLPRCDPPVGNLTDCLGSPPPSPATYVEVRLATRLPGNRFALPPTFAQAMAGNAGFDGASVGACARASWERATNTPVLAMTISRCEYNDLTRGGFGRERVIHFRAPESHDRCSGPDPPGPWRAPGPAGWLESGGDCLVQMPASRIIDGDSLEPPGFRLPSGCEGRLNGLRNTQAEVMVAVHDQVWRSGRRYRHVFLARVTINDYYFGGPRPPADAPCGRQDDDERCVSVVVVGQAPLSSLAGGPIVRLIG